MTADYEIWISWTAALILWLGLGGVIALDGVTFLLLFAGVGIFRGMVAPAKDRLVSSLTHSESTGKSCGLVYTGVTLGALIGPVLFGVIIRVKMDPNREPLDLGLR